MRSERAPKFGPNLPESSRPLSRPARSVVPLGATVVPLGAPVSSRSVPAKHTCRVLSARSLARILPSSPAFHVPKPACGSQRPRTTVSTRHGVPRPARAGMWRCQFCAATTVALVRTALTHAAQSSCTRPSGVVRPLLGRSLAPTYCGFNMCN